MNEKAFSSDGYIIDQDFTSEYQYGIYPSSYNGCGWIAMFNLMKAMGRNIGFETVYEEMNGILPFQGRQGTPMETMEQYMREKEIPFDYAEGKPAILEALPTYTKGIFRYAEKGDPHYVAFTRAGEGQFRFFNGDAGNERHVCSMEAFFREHAVSPRIRGFLVK